MGTCGIGVVDGEFLIAVAVEVAADHGRKPERPLLLDVLHDKRVIVGGKAVASAGQCFDASVREALQLDVLTAFAIVSATRLIGTRVGGCAATISCSPLNASVHALFAWYWYSRQLVVRLVDPRVLAAMPSSVIEGVSSALMLSAT